jgi:hypothetical protein
MVPNAGKIAILANSLYGAGAENLILKLGQTNVTPSETDVPGTYSECNFTGYAAVTLTASQTGGTWSVPTITANLAISTYAVNAVFSITSGSQTVYMFYLVGASSGILYYSEAFPAGKPISGPSDTITLTPKIAQGHL